MVKERTIFRCQVCGRIEPKWMGRCSACETWDSLIEERSAPSSKKEAAKGPPPKALAGIDSAGESRLATGLGELDRVLGGGIMAGSAVLIGGDPGIGKSTLMLQVLGHLAASAPVLYVSGEESARQLRLRADRLGIAGDQLYVLTETRVEGVLPQVAALDPAVVVVDSIQTLHTDSLTSAPGSLAQMREAAARMTRLAKESELACFLVGHVTKTGALAGPRLIEHLVDTVVYFEGDGSQGFRLLRAVKNRFGSTNEIGVFEMGEAGLAEVANPSALFLAERPAGQPGSVVVPCLEGSRPILVEIQALTAPSAYSAARRAALGVDPARVAMLTAVLEKKIGLNLAGQDTYVNAVGGVKVGEPAADLGIALALASSHLDKAVGADLVFLGEVGLAGELRSVSRAQLRLAEASKLGFERAVVPQSLAKQMDQPGLKLIGAEFLGQALEAVLG